MDFLERTRLWSLRRQLLGRPAQDPLAVLQQVVGVYSSNPSGPLSLLARCPKLSPGDVVQMDGEGTALRIPSMRLSAYLVPAWTAGRIMAAVVPAADDPIWEKRYSARGRGLEDASYQRWKKRVLETAVQPMPAAEIRERAEIPAESIKLVLNRMAFERLLLRVGTPALRSNRLDYVTVRSWAPDRFAELDPDQSLVWLAGEYLRAFGPVRSRDFAWWSGVTMTRAAKALDAHETVTLQDDCLLAAGDLKPFESLRKTSRDQVDLLPQWDCYTMGYAPDGRRRLVSPDVQPRVYGKLGATGGNALGVVVVNGLVTGVWKPRFAGRRMRVGQEFFEKPGPATRAAIEKGFLRIGQFLEADRVEFFPLNG